MGVGLCVLAVDAEAEEEVRPAAIAVTAAAIAGTRWAGLLSNSTSANRANWRFTILGRECSAGGSHALADGHLRSRCLPRQIKDDRGNHVHGIATQPIEHAQQLDLGRFVAAVADLDFGGGRALTRQDAHAYARSAV
jgi:hypothetical protein